MKIQAKTPEKPTCLPATLLNKVSTTKRLPLTRRWYEQQTTRQTTMKRTSKCTDIDEPHYRNDIYWEMIFCQKKPFLNILCANVHGGFELVFLTMCGYIDRCAIGRTATKAFVIAAAHSARAYYGREVIHNYDTRKSTTNLINRKPRILQVSRCTKVSKNTAAILDSFVDCTENRYSPGNAKATWPKTTLIPVT